MPWKENNNKENKNISYQILKVLTKLKSAVNFDEQSLFITCQYISVKEEWIALGPQRDQTLQIHLKIHIYIMFVCYRVLNIWKPCLRDESQALLHGLLKRIVDVHGYETLATDTPERSLAYSFIYMYYYKEYL